MGIDLALIWLLIIAFSIMMYVVMDGFDLGIGLLFPLFRASHDRDVMMNTVAPVWDGNETWLVMGGAGLFGAFPLAYAVILDALAVPLTLMLMGLILRGVAFEFRFKATPERRHIWDKSFFAGSLIATFFQGMVLGGVINGFAVENRHYAGGVMDLITPLSLFCGLGLIAAYALLGSTWLIMKTDDTLQREIKKITIPLIQLLLAAIAVVSLWTPWSQPAIAARWFTLPNLFYFLPVPLLVLLSAWALWRAVIREDTHYSPFLYTLAIIFLGYSGLGISIWPNLIPPSISFRAAAAPPQSQGFMLVGALFILPLILVYTFWSYYVFRGKVNVDDGYH